MARTLQQQLDDLDAQIDKIEKAQGLIENSSRSSKLVRERLSALYAERRSLRKDVKASQPGGGSAFHQGRIINP